MLAHSVPKSRSLPPLPQELGPPRCLSEGEPPQTTSEAARGGCDPTHQHWPPGEPLPSGPGGPWEGLPPERLTGPGTWDGKEFYMCWKMMGWNGMGLNVLEWNEM